MSTSPIRTRGRGPRAALATALLAGLTPLATLAPTPADALPAATTAAASPPTGVLPGSGHAAAQGVATKAERIPGDVRLYRVRTSLLGRHQWYQQVKDGHVVVGGWYARHYNSDGDLVRVWDGRRRTTSGHHVEPRISSTTAVAKAASSTDAEPVGQPELMILPATEERIESRLVWSVATEAAQGSATAYVDATTGRVLERQRASKFAVERKRRALVTGRGRVFDPNPVVALQNPDIRDRKDRSTQALERAYRLVDLPRLRPDLGLRGRWVRIGNHKRASSSTNRYVYSRTDDRFEQVVAYHAVDGAQAYLQSLGFRSANAHAQRVVTNRYTYDNSFYNENLDVIHLGSGGVDDGEDVEIIWHEYGHAIQDDQVPSFGMSPQAGAIGEGFGDYFAVTMSQPTTSATRATPLSCVADWDSISYDRSAPHCLRRVDSQRTFERRSFDVHHDGMIWSRALWDLSRAMTPPTADVSARDMANSIIVESHFWMNPRITMPAAARITVRIARHLYGGQAAAAARTVFENRKILTS